MRYLSVLGPLGLHGRELSIIYGPGIDRTVIMRPLMLTKVTQQHNSCKAMAASDCHDYVVFERHRFTSSQQWESTGSQKRDI